MAAPLNLQAFRFVLVGILNTAFSYIAYAVLLFVGLDYRVANLGALLLGIAFGFRTQARLVFRHRERGRFPRYVLAWSMIYLLNIWLIAAILRQGLDAYVAGAITLVPVVCASYLVQKYWVFKTREQPAEPDGR